MTCPTWCTGGHKPLDEFHTSEHTGQWLSERVRDGEPEPIAVRVEQYVDGDGEAGPAMVAVYGYIGDHGELAELAVADALRLVDAVRAAAELAGADA